MQQELRGVRDGFFAPSPEEWIRVTCPGGRMNVVVCIKQVPSSEARIQIGANGRSIDRANLELVVNPYDEYAMEEALRTREKFGGTVTALSIGLAKAEEALRTCLALGADRALIVKEEALLGGDAIGIARILAEAIRPLEADLVLFGKVSIDVENHSIGVAVAELLGLPHASVVSKLEWSDERHLRVSREVEGATEVLEVELPAVLTAEKGLNEPRYTSLPGIMKAKKKPIEELTAAALGVDPAAVGEGAVRLAVVALEPPPMRAEGKKLTGDAREAVQTVMRSLRDERKLL
jgi:electron transfer flavoprotein beta subunit